MDTTAMTRPFGAARDRPGSSARISGRHRTESPGRGLGWIGTALLRCPWRHVVPDADPVGRTAAGRDFGVTRVVDRVLPLPGRQSARLSVCRIGSACRSRVEVYPTSPCNEDPGTETLATTVAGRERDHRRVLRPPVHRPQSRSPRRRRRRLMLVA